MAGPGRKKEEEEEEEEEGEEAHRGDRHRLLASMHKEEGEGDRHLLFPVEEVEGAEVMATPAANAAADEEEGEDDAACLVEEAAEAALSHMGRYSKPKKSNKRVAEPAHTEPGSSGGPGKKQKSASFLNQLRERAVKELDELCDKFIKQTLASGPLANKMKKLHQVREKLQSEVQDRDDEAAIAAVLAGTDLCEIGDLIASLITGFSAVKAATGPSLKLRGVLNRPALADFLRDMTFARKTPLLSKYIPQDFHELDLRIRTFRSLEEKALDDLADVVGIRHITESTGFSKDIAASVQKNLLSKLMVEAVAVGSFEEQQNNIFSWVHSVLKGDLHPDARAEVVLIDKFLSMGESEAGFRTTS